MKNFLALLLALAMIFALAACGAQEPVAVPVPAAIEGTYALWTISNDEEGFGVQMGSIEFSEPLILDEEWMLEGTHWQYATEPDDVLNGHATWLVHANLVEGFLGQMADYYGIPDAAIRQFLDDCGEDIIEEELIFFAIAI